MWDRLWLNARIATFEGPSPFGAIDGRAAIGVAQGRIAWIGPQRDLPGAPEVLADDVLDADGRWITPGLIDCHTHLVYAGNRAGEFARRLEGASYEEIARAGGGIAATVAATRAADAEALYRTSRRRLDALRAEGVTTIEIKSGYGLETATEMRMLEVATRLGQESGVRVVRTFLGAHAVAPGFDGTADDYIDMVCERMLPTVAAAGLAEAADAFCETIAFSSPQVARVFEAAADHGLKVKLHADQLSDSGGAALAAGFGALSADHLEYASEAGIEAMAAAGTVAVLLPGAFYMLGETHKPPIDAMRRHRLAMAIATDCNPGSAPVTSLLLMLNMACTLFGLTVEEALAGVTRNAARALGLADVCGTLALGKAADFVLWDIDDPVELCYRIGFNPCAGIVIAGVPVS